MINKLALTAELVLHFPDGVSVDQERHGCLETVFKDGQLVKETTLAEIREITDKI